LRASPTAGDVLGHMQVQQPRDGDVMAGGRGSRLMPFTDKRSKPAVPFGSRYRIVDFVLSNLVNSGIFTVYLLVQYKSQSLIEHIRESWTIPPLFSNQFVTVVPPQKLESEGWFTGTADAICQNLNLIEKAACIGWDAEQDRERYTVSPSGVVVVPRGKVPSPYGEGRSFTIFLFPFSGMTQALALQARTRTGLDRIREVTS